MKEKIVDIISAMLILLFAYTAFSKFFGMEEFTGTIYNQPIPHWLGSLLIWPLPIAEIVAAGCLLFPKTKRKGLILSLLLLTLFTLYIGAILLHWFRKTPCSCGGIFRHLSWQQHLWVNLFLLTLTILALFISTKKQISSPLNLST